MFEIKLNIIKRSIKSADLFGITIENLLNQHRDKVISQKIGQEANPNSSKKIIVLGAKKQKILRFKGNINPFWGFDPATGERFINPQFVIRGRRRGVSIDELIEIFNKIDEEKFRGKREELEDIQTFLQENWGKRFIIELDKENEDGRGFFDSEGVSFVTPIAKGWLENDNNPDNLTNAAKGVLQSFDGRWFSFVKLPAVSVGWNDTVLNNKDVYGAGRNKLYMRCKVNLLGKFLILEMPQSLIEAVTEAIIGGGNIRRRIRGNIDLNEAWIALEDSRERYGPWVNDEQASSNIKSDGGSEIIIRDGYNPWIFSRRDLTNSQAIGILDELVISTLILTPEQKIVLSTADIQVADLPKVSLGQIIKGGSAITQINIQFNISNITTVYRIKTFVSSNKIQQLQKAIDNLNDDLLKSQCKDPEEVKEELQIEREDLGPPTSQTLWLHERLKAGAGIITDAVGGPFYNVARMATPQLSVFTPAGFQSTIPKWLGIRNMAEDDDSPGYLLPGTRVEVTLYDTGRPVPVGTPPGPIGIDEGPFKDLGGEGHFEGDTETIKKPVFSLTPPTFAPPRPTNGE